MLRVGDVGWMDGKCRDYDSGGQMIFDGQKIIARQRPHGKNCIQRQGLKPDAGDFLS
jgi:hypothetical protein